MNSPFLLSGLPDIKQRQLKCDNHYPVEAIQSAWELEALLSIYRLLKPMRVLELGVYIGGTLYQWIMNAPAGATVVGVDLGMGADRVATWSSWRQDVTFVGVGGYTDQVVDKVKAVSPEYDFLFIDADHTYEGAKKDFLNYAPLVRKGGIIAIYDIYPVPENGKWPTEMWRLWSEIQRAGYVTQELSDGGDYYGIGVIYI